MTKNIGKNYGLKGRVIAFALALCLLFGGILGENAADVFGMAKTMAEADNFADKGEPVEMDGSKIEGIDIFWITPDSTVNNEGDATSASELADDQHLFVATKSDAPLRMTFQFEISLSGQYDYNPGDIQITLPAYVFQSRAYDGEGSGVPDAQTRHGLIDLSVPAAPSVKADFNWTMVDGNYVITNTRRIGATSKAMFQASVMDLIPHEVLDMVDCDPIVIRCDVTTHAGNNIYRTSPPIRAQVDTIAQVRATTKSSMDLFEYYPGDVLPDELLRNLPAGTDKNEYVYVRWYSYVYHEGNQPFSLDIQDMLLDAQDEQGNKVTDGIFLGVVGIPGNTRRPDGAEYALHDATILTNTYHATTSQPYDHMLWIWSAYKRADMPAVEENGVWKTYYLNNEITWTLTETDSGVAASEMIHSLPDDVKKVTETADAAQVHYTPVGWIAPVGKFGVTKWTERSPYKDWNYSYGLNALQLGKNVDMNFVVRSSAIGYAWTKPAGEEDIQENYGKLGWKMVTDDFQTFFADIEAPLTSEDFRIKALRIGEPDMRRYDKLSTGNWGYFQDDSLPVPDLKIEYKIDDGDTWLHAATARWGEDGTGDLYFADVNTAAGIKAEASSATVYFPENTTDIRHTYTSNVFSGKTAEHCDTAMIVWDVYPVITLKSSENTKAIADKLFKVSDTPTAKFKNDASVDAYGRVGSDGQGIYLGRDYDFSRATVGGAGYGVTMEKKIRFNPASTDHGGDNDTENQRVILHYTAYVYEQSNLSTLKEYENAVAESVIPAETKGVWYDLLPEGADPLLNTVRLRGNDIITNMYTVPNYKGTGRTLLVVEASLTPSPEEVKIEDAYGSIVWRDCPTLFFDAVYTWDDIDQFGDEPVNYVAFESLSDGLYENTLGTFKNEQGNPDDPRAGKNATTPHMPDAILDALTDLDPNTDENRFVYGSVMHGLDIDTSAVSAIKKTVRNDLVGVWTQGLEISAEQVTVFEGHNYTYRLHVTSDKNTTTTDIIIYDTLENFTPVADADDVSQKKDLEDLNAKKNWQGDWAGKGQWRGTLLAVDVQEMINAGAAPVIYYSTVENLQFADSDPDAELTPEERLELFNSGAYNIESDDWAGSVKTAELVDGVWTIPESLKGSITALAIDVRKKADGSSYELKENESISAYLHMVAPDDNGDPESWVAKGAFAHKTDDEGNPLPEIDWEKTVDPANNMYAFNNTRLKCVQRGGSSDESSNQMIRNDYTRVGIVSGFIGIKKEWDDQNDHDGYRPESVKLTLLRKVVGETGDYQVVLDQDGQPVSVTLSDENDWAEYIFQIDRVNERGEYYIYSFREECENADKYELGITTGDMIHYTLTNVHRNEQVQPTGQKVWNDRDDQFVQRPASITVRLMRNGEEIAEQTVTPDADGMWYYDFGSLDRFDGNGNEYVYTVKEDYVPKYVGSSEHYLQLVNDYAPYGDLAIIKNLDGATSVSRNKQFTFLLTLLEEQTPEEIAKGEVPQPLTQSYPYSVFSRTADGSGWQDTPSAEGTVSCGGSITVTGDQKIVVYGLPSESSYIIEEMSVPGFTLEETAGDEGVIHAGGTEEAVFTNRYRAEGYVQFDALKKLSGHVMQKGEFRFQIKDVTPGSATEGMVLRQAVNGSPENISGGNGEAITCTGKVVFGQINYTEADAGRTYIYEISEVDEGKGGHIYDQTVYTAEVTVTDKGDGTLDVVSDIASEDIIFNNKYEAEGTLQLRAWKSMTKRELKAGEFTFSLYEYDATEGDKVGEAIATATNDADGNIVFPIRFDHTDLNDLLGVPAVYQYLVAEEKGEDPTVIYTDQEYIVTVSVYDNKDGTLGFVQQTDAVTRRHDCLRCGGDGWIVGEVSGFDYRCTQCGGTGEDSWLEDSDDDAIPVFENDLENGSLEVYKWVEGEADTETEFTFHVRLTGENLPDTITYTRVQVSSDTSEQVLYMAPRNIRYTAPRAASTVYTLPESEKMKFPFAVQDADGTLTFVRLERGADGNFTYGGVTFSGSEFTSNMYEPQNGTITVIYDLMKFEAGAYAFPPWHESAHSSSVKTIRMEGGLQPESCRYMFSDFINAETIVLDKMDTSTTTTMVGMFQRMGAVKKLDLSGFDTQNTTNLSSMFQNNKSLEEVVFGSSFTAKNVTEIERMFMNCGSLKTLDISMFGTVKADVLSSMFAGCSALEKVNASGFGTTASNANMGYMFSNCGSLKEVDLTGFVTTGVTNMNSMFVGCDALESLDLSSFDTSNVTTMYNMFLNCSALKSIDLSSFNTENVTDFANMFRMCSALESIDVSNFNTANCSNFSGMFSYMYALKKLDVSNFVITEGDDITQMLATYEVGFGRELILCDSISKGTGSNVMTGSSSITDQTKPVVFQCQKVTIPENCKLNVADKNPPTTGGYTGKWIHKESGMTVDSSVELFNGTQPKGVWEWEYRGYTIRFDPGEGAGGATSIITSGLDEDVRFNTVGTFYKFGYEFKQFKDQFNNIYEVDESGWITIPGGTYTQTDIEIVLTPIWEKVNLNANIENGMFEFTLPGNAKAVFENCLPAGTAYEVWEETPAGWVLVAVKDESGKIESLKTSVAEFTNKNIVDEVRINLRAGKRLDGAAADDGAFTFTLTGEGVSQTKTNTDGGAIAFDTITLRQAGTYTYTISETKGDDAGIEYDDSTYTATVTVSDTEDGLKAEVVYADANGMPLSAPPVFKNETKSGKLILSKKTVGATEAAANKTFTFVVTFIDDKHMLWEGNDGKVNTTAGAVALEDGQATVAVTGAGSITFTDLPQALRYEVREEGALPGWQMDTSVKSGEIDAGSADEVVFTNTYSASGGVVLEANKVLEGREMENGEFVFVLSGSDGGEIERAEVMYQRIQTNPDAPESEEPVYEDVYMARFNMLVFDREGEYRYTITELEGTDDAIEYGSETIDVKVTVTDESGEGVLTAEAEYTVNGEKNNTITNKVKTGSLSLNKTVISTVAEHKNQEFIFNLDLSDALGNKISGEFPVNGGESTLQVNNGYASVPLTDGETVVIDGLPHDTRYEITENTLPGFTVSGTGGQGTIQHSTTTEEKFVNTYHAQGQYTFKAQKALEGASLEDISFVFELVEVISENGTEKEVVLFTAMNEEDGSVTFNTLQFTEQDAGAKKYIIREKNTGKAGVVYDETEYEMGLTIVDDGRGVLVINGGMTESEPVKFTNTYSNKTSVSATKQWVGDESDPSARRPVVITLLKQVGTGDKTVVDSKTIPADASGEALTVTWENLPAVETVTYDTADGAVSVDMDIFYTVEESVVLAQGEKNLYESVIMGSAEEGFTVINRYNAVKVQLEAEKILKGDALAAEQFSFVLKDANGNVIETVKNDAEGSVLFSEIVYAPTETGIYNYTISEVSDQTDETVAYDETSYGVTVEVDRDADGKLEAEVSYAGERIPTFENAMNPGSLALTKTVESTVEAHDAKEFTFSLLLKDKDGNALNGEYALSTGGVLTVVDGMAEVKIRNGETVTISGLPHKTVYEVTEQEESGFAQNGVNTSGQILAARTSEAAFTNVYASSGEYTFTAEKMLNGKELEADAFVFELVDAQGNVLQTVKNAADGSVAFEKLTFTHNDAGEKVYILREKDTAEENVIYDETVYEVKLSITDNGDGTITVTDDVSEDGLTFINYYINHTDISATKQWTGDEENTALRRDLLFTLYRTDADGNTEQYGENKEIKADATGDALTVTWENVPKQYLKDDTLVAYVYSVGETVVLNEGEKNVYETTMSGGVENGFVITNRYESTEAVLTAHKTLLYGQLAGDEFTFELRDAEDNLIETVSNAADGTVTFSPLTYVLGDMIQIPVGEDGTRTRTYTYTLTEVNGEDIQYTYDPAVYTATVTVCRDTEGHLSTSVAYAIVTDEGEEAAETAEFVNEVKTVSFTVTKEWQGGGGGAIELTLYANGEKMDPQPVCERDGDRYTYNDLPQFKDGEAVVYYAKERYMDGFITIYDNIAPYESESRKLYDGGTVINRKVKDPAFMITKIWKGLDDQEQAPEIELILYCNGVATDVKTPVPNSRGEYRYYDLPTMVNDEPAVYTVKEVPLAGYAVKHELADGRESDHADNGGRIVNTKIPATGDRFVPALWMLLLAASALMITVIRKKQTR